MQLELFNYSVDMVVMATEVPVKEFQEIIEMFQNSPNCSYWETNQITAYRHNFNFKDQIQNDDAIYREFLHGDYFDIIRVDKMKECSFFLGALHNAKFGRDRKYVDLTIKYNPNKCFGSTILDYILQAFFCSNNNTVVKNIDFAIDIPLAITDVHLIRDYKKNYKVFDNGGTDKTYYQGARGNGYTKVYNKKKESNLDIPGELTRYEVTIGINCGLKFMGCYTTDKSIFPKLRLTENVQMNFGDTAFKVTGTDKVLLLACMEHPEYLKELSRKKREKIEELLHSLDNEISFDNCKIIDNVINTYFTTINKVI